MEPCFSCTCFVHYRRPKIPCPNCGVKQINAPLERKNGRFTLMFEGVSMMLLPDVPVSKVSGWRQCDENPLVRIMGYGANNAVAQQTLVDLLHLAIDEISFHKGHSHAALMIDAVKRSAVDGGTGRDGGTADAFAEMLPSRSVATPGKSRTSSATVLPMP